MSDVINLTFKDLIVQETTKSAWNENNINSLLKIADRAITMIEKRSILTQTHNTHTKQIKNDKQEIARKLYHQYIGVMELLRDNFNKTTITEAIEFIKENEVAVIKEIEKGL